MSPLESIRARISVLSSPTRKGTVKINFPSFFSTLKDSSKAFLKCGTCSKTSKLNTILKESFEKSDTDLRSSEQLIQKYTLEVLSLYEEILRKDLLKIETGLKKVNDNYLVSLNTFQTVTVAADLASLMAENSNLFNEVMSIQVPELIPFENLQMQKEFEALTLQLSN